ncbi:MAG TPA: hypothetical protein VGN14_07625 [Candidatus Elarobacter sp.]
MTPRNAYAPGAALVARMVRTTLAVAALTCATSVGAWAQTVPSASAPATAQADATATTATAPTTSTAATAAPSTTQSTTVAQTTPAGAPARPAPGFSNFPIIDFVVTFTQPGGVGPSGTLPAVGGPGVVAGKRGLISQYHSYDPIDLGGTFRLPITKKLYFAFDRVTEGTLNQAVERTIISPPLPPGVAAGPIYPGVSRDIILQYRADYQLTPQILVELGESFRHRLYANDGSGVSGTPFLCANGQFATTSTVNGQVIAGGGCTVSSTEHHYGYLGLTYTTRPIKELWYSTFAFNLTGDRQNVDHNVAVTCSGGTIAQMNAGDAKVNGCRNAAGVPTVAATTVGYLDENPSQSAVYETTQGVTWNLPLDRKRRVVLSDRFRWGALNFYENQPFPFRWAAANDVILTKVFSPGLSVALRHSDYHTIQMGTVGVNGLAPFGTFLSPNAIHVASWDVIATFHVDTKTWLGH